MPSWLRLDLDLGWGRLLLLGVIFWLLLLILWLVGIVCSKQFNLPSIAKQNWLCPKDSVLILMPRSLYVSQLPHPGSWCPWQLSRGPR